MAKKRNMRRPKCRSSCFVSELHDRGELNLTAKKCVWIPDLPGGVICLGCRAKRPTERVRACPQPAPPCPHLGKPIERDGVAVRVKCGCSKKNQKRMMPAYKCEVRKRCLPTAKFSLEQLASWSERPEAELYQLCQTCEDRQAPF